MFSDEQEIDLGDAMAESLARHTTIIDDDTLADYLRTLGDRLIQHLPPTKMKFRFYLIELSDVNAFSIAGGRVYVSRKMVALTHSDDELAGILAHELGHIVTHQSAIDATRRFHEALGITQVVDRADIFARFHQYLENEARKPIRGSGPNDDKDQYIADQVAVFATARAGFAPHAYVDLWDRFQQTHGKTGSWFSDLFQTTKPSERRLREMLKDVSALPQGCADIPPSSHTTEFAKWQAQVLNYDQTRHTETLPGLVLKQKLALPLRPDISHLRFSLNGKYLLAQDEAGIHVLTREPFALLFYIPALDALPASFTPDSSRIVFYNHSLRVETWALSDQKRSVVHEVTIPHHCLQTTLSPDGLTLACFDEQLELNLIDVTSSQTIFSKGKFYDLNFTQMGVFYLLFLAATEGGNPSFLHMGFSPDGRYFLAGHHGTHVAFDLTSRHEASLPGSIKDVSSASFAFVGPDRIAGVDLESPGKSPILQFPAGQRVDQLPLGNGVWMKSAAHGDYLVVGPLKEYFSGVLDLKTKKIVAAVKEPAVDIYDGTLVHEGISGDLSLDAVDSKQHIASFRLPQAQLGMLRAVAVSPDLNWLTVSNSSRGAVWDVSRNIRTMHIRSFHGAWFGDDQTLYADAPKFEQTERQIAHLVPLTGAGTPGYKIGDVRATQFEQFLVVTTPKNKNQVLNPQDADVEIKDVRDGHSLWTHHFAHEVPGFFFDSGKILFAWAVSESGGHDELQRFPELKAHADKDDYLCEVLEVGKDDVVGKVLIKSNKHSFRLEHAIFSGPWIIAAATGNQILTYDLNSGEEKGHFFGSRPVVSSTGGMLAVENESGQIKLYDLATSQLRRELVFSGPISFKRFSPDGKRLFVLTANQTVYILDLTASN